MKKRAKKSIIYSFIGIAVFALVAMFFAFSGKIIGGNMQIAQVVGVQGILGVSSITPEGIPSSTIIQIDNNTSTDDVELLTFGFSVRGSNDMTIKRIPITIFTSDNAVSDVVSSVTLETEDGQEFTKAVPVTTYNNAIVSFSGIAMGIDAGDKLEVTVTVNLKPRVAYVDGTTLRAELTAGNVRSIQAYESGSAAQLPQTNLQGFVKGNSMALYDHGLFLELISSQTSVIPGPNINDDIATFTIRFKAIAFDDDIFIPKTVSISPTNTLSHIVRLQRSNGSWIVPQRGVSLIMTSVSGASTSADGQNFRIAEGDSEIFQVTLMLDNSVLKSSGSYKTLMAKILWSDDDRNAVYTPVTFNLGLLATDFIVIN